MAATILRNAHRMSRAPPLAPANQLQSSTRAALRRHKGTCHLHTRPLRCSRSEMSKAQKPLAITARTVQCNFGGISDSMTVRTLPVSVSVSLNSEYGAKSLLNRNRL